VTKAFTLSRRHFGGAALGTAALLASRPAAAQSGITITVNGSGGTLAQVLTRIYEQPFTQRTGIRVRAVAPVSLPKLRAMVETGSMEWDLTELGGHDLIEAQRNGWLQEIDWTLVDPEKKLPDFARAPFGMTTATFSTVLAYRTDRLGGKAPSGWADFWDMKGFPGPRSLQDSPVQNLEFALLADGVPADKLYPLDVDRAFRKLNAIKPHIATWWRTGAQHVQLLTDGEVVMTSVWNGRITPLRNEGKPVDISWGGGALQQSYWGIPKGAKHPREAMQYMSSRLDPEAGARFVAEVPYPGFIPGLMERLDPKVARDLPVHPDNVAVQYRFDPAWWADQRAPVTERWNAWLLT
jgi:putative spermidine/putrescine transport system substrate-binding protein